MTTDRPLGKRFRRFWIGESINVVGTSTSAALIPLIAIFDLGAGPIWLGLLTASTWLPWLIIGVPVGVLVDSGSPRQIMITANLVAAGVLSTIPVAAALGVLSLPQLAVVAVLSGCCTVLFRTAYPVLVTELVASDQLESANARLQGAESVANATGPGIAGVVTQAGSAALGMAAQVGALIVSASFLVSVGPSRRIRVREWTGSWRSRVGAGLRYVVRDPLLRPMTVAGGVANFGQTGIATLLVLHLATGPMLPPLAIGIVVSTATVGGVVGAAVAPALARRFGNGRCLMVLIFAQLGTILIPLGQVAWVIGVGMLVNAFAVVAGNVLRSAWRQGYVPPGLLGRSVSASQLVNYGTMPVAAVATGYVAAAAGVPATLAGMVAVIGIAALILARSPWGRYRVLPQSSGE